MADELKTPLQYRGKLNGEAWFRKGVEDALAGNPMAPLHEIVQNRRGSIAGSRAWQAYKTGFEAARVSQSPGPGDLICCEVCGNLVPRETTTVGKWGIMCEQCNAQMGG